MLDPEPKPPTPKSDDDDEFEDAAPDFHPSVPPAVSQPEPPSGSSGAPLPGSFPSGPAGREACLIRVEGIPASMKEEILLQLFENKRRSGGGEITDVKYSQGSGTAVITFADPAGRLATKPVGR